MLQEGLKVLADHLLENGFFRLMANVRGDRGVRDPQNGRIRTGPKQVLSQRVRAHRLRLRRIPCQAPSANVRWGPGPAWGGGRHRFAMANRQPRVHSPPCLSNAQRGLVWFGIGARSGDRARTEHAYDGVTTMRTPAALPPEVARSVYERMKAERQRIAKKYRSEGEEEAVKIKATTDKEKTILLAESYREAEKLKGEGDAEAIKIYADAFEKDPEFYAFVRTLQAYENSMGSQATVVLPSDSEFFQYLSPPKK